MISRNVFVPGVTCRLKTIYDTLAIARNSLCQEIEIVLVCKDLFPTQKKQKITEI